MKSYACLSILVALAMHGCGSADPAKVAAEKAAADPAKVAAEKEAADQAKVAAEKAAADPERVALALKKLQEDPREIKIALKKLEEDPEYWYGHSHKHGFTPDIMRNEGKIEHGWCLGTSANTGGTWTVVPVSEILSRADPIPVQPAQKALESSRTVRKEAHSTVRKEAQRGREAYGSLASRWGVRLYSHTPLDSQLITEGGVGYEAMFVAGKKRLDATIVAALKEVADYDASPSKIVRYPGTYSAVEFTEAKAIERMEMDLQCIYTEWVLLRPVRLESNNAQNNILNELEEMIQIAQSIGKKLKEVTSPPSTPPSLGAKVV